MSAELSDIPLPYLFLFVALMAFIILINPWFLVIMALLVVGWIAFRKYVWKSG